MSTAVHSQFSGPAWRAAQESLRALLATPGHPPVFNKESGEYVRPRDLLFSCKGMDFTYHRTLKCVKWIKPIRKTPIWQSCYRTTESCVIPVADDWGRPTEWKVVEGNIPSLFDQLPA